MSPRAAAEYSPFTVGTRLRLVPPGAPAATDGRLDLVMARGAFGSGEHETTASCLEALERLPAVAGARLLDVGSGTGILALAALRLGAASAVCLDVEAAAVASTVENAALNGLGARVRTFCGPVAELPERGFDLVLANLHGDLLLGLAAAILERTRPGGTLLLSGILWEHCWDVRARYLGAGCELVSERFLEEYATLVLRAP